MSITNYKQYAAKIINKHLRILAKQQEGCRLPEASQNIECIHRMRTSSRRIRIAFWIFRDLFPGKNLKKWKKRLRRTAKSLGEARDLDTQIIFIKEFRNTMPQRSYGPGIDSLLQVLLKKRKGLQSNVIKALDDLEKSKTLAKIKKSLKKISRSSGKKNIGKLYGLGKKLILRRTEDMLGIEPFVNRPDKIKELHGMRIAAKKLRYTLESFRLFYGNKINTFIYSAWQVQSSLGKLHDFDVWIKSLPELTGQVGIPALVPKKQNSKDLKNAVTYFVNNCRVFRSQTYREFVELWKRQKQAKVWEKLVGWINDRV